MTAALLRLVRPAVAALALGVIGRVAAQGEIPKGSPFMPVGGAAATIAPGETIEFAAVRVIGKQTDINLYDTQGKKNHWIPLGGNADGMSVLSYDARREVVVAKIDGVNKTLALRKSRTAGGPAPIVNAPAMSFNTPAQPATVTMEPFPQPPPLPTAAAPVAENTSAVAAPPQPAPTPAQPAQPLSIARQEEEARMLVSDLLEIGMAQRKAYEEKQKQAADPNAAPQTPPAAAPAPSPNGPPGGT